MSSNVGITTKICNKCHLEKDLVADFHVSKISKDGRYNSCKECRKKKPCTKQDGNKLCNKCGKIKSTNDFFANKSKKDGCDSCCKDCAKVAINKYLTSYDGYMKFIFSCLKYNANKRNIEVSITLDDLYDLYKKQNGLCALSSLELTYVRDSDSTNETRVKYLYNMSVDRIDSKLSYAKDNVQLICSIFNVMKWDLQNDDFIKLTKIITNKNKKKLL